MKNSINNIHSINRYFYTGCLNRYDVLMSRIHPSIPFKTNASYINRLHKETPAIHSGKNTYEEISLNYYNGNNNEVNRIIKYLEQELPEDIHSAILHGSFATGDNISFSDFDGLIILKDEVFNDSKRLHKVAKRISKSCSIMIKLDPLQHHGWFIFRESDCNNWPETIFPGEIIHNSKILYSQKDSIKINFYFDELQARENLLRLIKSTQIKLTQRVPPSELYSLKSNLSEFMLLPSIFLQYKMKKGIYKKYSFSEASGYFDKDDYAIMNEVSDIRKEWPAITSSLNLHNLTYVSPQLKKQQRLQSLPVPAGIATKLTSSFYNRMYILTEKMKSLII